MSQNGLPPPPPGCLWRPYSSNPLRKGGTVIVEDVGDRDAHERRRRDPDGYRLVACPGCGFGKLHVHDYPERKVHLITLVRYLCPACRATWRMMPMFLARMLWRSWPEVEAATIGRSPLDGRRTVPGRTACRWRARLATAAASLIGMFRERGSIVPATVAARVGEAATRLQFLAAFAEATRTQVTQRLARLAVAIHVLMPGVRLM
jgi:hypothetical protein